MLACPVARGMGPAPANLNVSASAFAKVMFGEFDFCSSIGANAPQATINIMNLGGERLVSHGKGSNISSSYNRTGSNDMVKAHTFLHCSHSLAQYRFHQLFDQQDHPRNQVLTLMKSLTSFFP